MPCCPSQAVRWRFGGLRSETRPQTRPLARIETRPDASLLHPLPLSIEILSAPLHTGHRLTTQTTLSCTTDTLIVWTEPDGTDIALSFANPEGCESIWGFILEVQKMLDNGASLSPPSSQGNTHSLMSAGHEEEIYAASSSSPPMARFRSATPPNVRRIREKARTLIRPGLGKLQWVTLSFSWNDWRFNVDLARPAEPRRIRSNRSQGPSWVASVSSKRSSRR